LYIKKLYVYSKYTWKSNVYYSFPKI